MIGRESIVSPIDPESKRSLLPQVVAETTTEQFSLLLTLMDLMGKLTPHHPPGEHHMHDKTKTKTHKQVNFSTLDKLLKLSHRSRLQSTEVKYLKYLKVLALHEADPS